MKILHLIAGNFNGGAARGAYWLHRGLKSLGVASRILTNSFDTLGDGDVKTIANTHTNKIKSKIYSQLDGLPAKAYRKRNKIIFSTGFWGKQFYTNDLLQWADIVHLHWINAGFVDLKYISRIDKPMVWTMRDMWPMTGGCHYALDCDRYESGCGKCPQLGSRHAFDLSKMILKRKRKYIPKTVKMVGISSWLSACAQKSLLFHEFDIRTIPNNIDCSQFFPIRKSEARHVLGLPQNAQIILVGSTRLEDFYKGFSLFLESTRSLPADRFHIVFFGNALSQTLQHIKIPHTHLGYLHDIISLRLAYSAADVFVAPSIMDAFGKTIAESMACGTPVVCFDATGPKDIVDHTISGYKAKAFDPKDLAHGIKWVLGNNDRYQMLAQNARKKVEKTFDIHVIAKKYISLYSEMLNR